ncbi:MAG: sulfatase-like hydrolase/transferase [Bacteroidetes bacterium]|nr:sulfatase-like hydrolase/transferase [Bacteroidota bacterium]MBT7092669.1 sulfatase-like hydrolase/transferase [Bacteroidota bacterium]
MNKLFFLLLSCVVVIFSACKNENPKQLPNILWITCEDISPFLGCYGDEQAHTPNLDDLAKQGVLFSNFYANAPVCAPARFTILTGVHASSAGTMNMRSQYRIPDEWKTYPEYLQEAGYYCTNNSKTDYNHFKPGKFWDESSNKAHYKNRASGQPFFAVFNYTTTHESKIFNYKPEDLKHSLHDMVLPDYVPDRPAIREDMARLYDNISRMDKQAGELLLELEELGLKDSTIVFYYSDHGGVYPRAKRFLHRTGTWVPLIIRFPDMYAHLAPEEAGGSTDRLTSFVDLAPTVLSLAGINAPDYMEGSAFLGDYESTPQQELFLFRNRMDERIDFMRAITDGRYRYQMNFMPHRPHGQYLEYLWRAASMQAWDKAYQNGECNEAQSAFWEAKPVEELYDMGQDPWEVSNLANESEFSGVLTKMRSKLKNRMLDLHDSGFIPEGMMKEINDSSIPYQFTRSESYPLEPMLDLMLAPSTSGGEYKDKLLAGLRSENDMIRYWAAVKCISLEEVSEDIRAGLIILLPDENAEVSLMACEALYKLGEKDLVLPLMKNHLADENEWVVLLALNIIEYFAAADQMFLQTELEGLLKDERIKYIVRASDRILKELRN